MFHFIKMKKNKLFRTFIPGSEWVYFKVYLGSASSDKFLIEQIAKLTATIERKGFIHNWFFIRYFDPDFHIRLRLLIKDTHDIGAVLNIVYSYFQRSVKTGIVWKIQIDTYNREIERYSENKIIDAETLFGIDSKFTLKTLKCLNQYHCQEKERILTATRIIDAYLECFGYDLNRKQKLLNIMDMSFRMEFGYNDHNKKQLNAMYREFSIMIENILSDKEISQDIHWNLIATLTKKRINAMQAVASAIKTGISQDKLDEFMRSYIHMMMNRLFCSRNRLYELLTYNFLSRHYVSQIARLNSNK